MQPGSAGGSKPARLVLPVACRTGQHLCLDTPGRGWDGGARGTCLRFPPCCRHRQSTEGAKVSLAPAEPRGATSSGLLPLPPASAQRLASVFRWFSLSSGQDRGDRRAGHFHPLSCRSKPLLFLFLLSRDRTFSGAPISPGPAPAHTPRTQLQLSWPHRGTRQPHGRCFSPSSGFSLQRWG